MVSVPCSASPLCGEHLCRLGATISPSNSFQPGIHTAFPVPFPVFEKPGLLQRDRQLVGLGEVSFDVPDSAKADLFAHIKTGGDTTIKTEEKAGWHHRTGLLPVCHILIFRHWTWWEVPAQLKMPFRNYLWFILHTNKCSMQFGKVSHLLGLGGHFCINAIDDNYMHVINLNLRIYNLIFLICINRKWEALWEVVLHKHLFVFRNLPNLICVSKANGEGASGSDGLLCSVVYDAVPIQSLFQWGPRGRQPGNYTASSTSQEKARHYTKTLICEYRS